MIKKIKIVKYDTDRALFDLFKNGEYSLLQKLIDNGISVNSQDEEDKNTILHLFVFSLMKNNTEKIKNDIKTFLVNNPKINCNIPNRQNETPYGLAFFKSLDIRDELELYGGYLLPFQLKQWEKLRKESLFHKSRAQVNKDDINLILTLLKSLSFL